MNRFIILLIVSAISASAQTPVSEQPTLTQSQAEQLAMAVLPSDGHFHKWTTSPTISCVGQMVKFKPVVEKCIADVCSILAGLPVQPVIVADDQPSADILLCIGTPQEYGALLRDSKWNWKNTFNADHSIKRSVVF